MTTLENEIFTLTINEAQGTFCIQPKEARLPGVSNARLGVSGRSAKGKFAMELAHWSMKPVEQKKSEFGMHGDTEFVTYQWDCAEQALRISVEFGIVQETPLVVWKVAVTNIGYAELTLDRIEMLNVNGEGSYVTPQTGKSLKRFGFYSNGWQSWSPTGWYPANGRMQISKLGGLQHPMIYNPGTPLPKKRGQFSSDMFAVIGDRETRTGYLIGFLSQKQQFGSIFKDFNDGCLCMWANCDDARLEPGKTMHTDWAVFNPVLLDHRDPLEKYLEAVARENDVNVPAESPVGWCSWYHFYTHLTEKDVQANLQTILAQQETLPIQLVQIDDGFESQIGDWFTFKPGFPNGVKLLADEISSEGLIPGLWLAPFIVHPKSKLAQEHPDWLLRKANGKAVNCGFVWNALDTALDLTVPEALDYACSVVRTAASEWGYPYLKLDFLYAAAVKCRYKDPTLTRAQVLRRGMEAIRAAAGREVTLLGCGAPLGSVIGLIQANRIGADVSGDWTPNFNGIRAVFKNEPGMPSARNSIHNILTRAALHQHWWINDPDCLLLRPDTHLSLAEVQSLASAISLTGGSLLLSDDLPKLAPERRRMAEVLLPVIGERVRVLDWFDAEMPEMLRLDQLNAAGERHVLAKFNGGDAPLTYVLTPEKFKLAPGSYWVSEFWSGKCGKMSGDLPFSLTIAPHGCAVVTAQVALEGAPAYIGSDLHISQGMEVVDWQASEGSITATLRLPRSASGNIVIFHPGELLEFKVNDKIVVSELLSPGMHRIPVNVDGFATLEILPK